MFKIISALGLQCTAGIAQMGEMALFLWRSIRVGVRPPYRFLLILQQAEFIGFGSLFIVFLTGIFTGAVFSLQSIDALQKVGMENMVGSTVMMAVARELAPVLTALMVTGRVGSAMATELGTMRVSEQIDAMEVMAVDPLSYLIVPRMIASIIMVPCLCIIFNFVAGLGAYIVSVEMMHIDEGAFIDRIKWYVDFSDIAQGLYKSVIFGLMIAVISCYKGFYARGGARGVGIATTQTVVTCSVVIFILDYIMTSIILQFFTTT